MFISRLSHSAMKLCIRVEGIASPSARNDIVLFCHCEERSDDRLLGVSDEAISQSRRDIAWPSVRNDNAEIAWE